MMIRCEILGSGMWRIDRLVEAYVNEKSTTQLLKYNLVVDEAYSLLSTHFQEDVESTPGPVVKHHVGMESDIELDTEFSLKSDMMSTVGSSIGPELYTEPNTKRRNHVLQTLWELERERLCYFIREYILVRLRKIHHNLFIDESILCPEEIEYYRSYKDLIRNAGIDIKGTTEYQRYVGFHCKKSLGMIRIDDEAVEVMEGDFLVTKLDEVLPYLNSGDISLV